MAIAVPGSRIAEIANIAQAVEGMTDALGETAQRRAEADEARRFLVTSIAHDLRTPLFALRGHLQAIGSGLGDPALHLVRAEARADALERLIGNLFAYTRDDYAQPAPQLEGIPVAELLQDVTAGVEHTAHLRANTFDLDGDQALVAIVDRDRVKRALTNILDNAIRYSPAGAAIRLSWTAADESTVEITIQDHGPGIDPELLPHIFEPGIRGTPAAGSAGRWRRARTHDRETPPRAPTRHPDGWQPADRRRKNQPDAPTSASDKAALDVLAELPPAGAIRRLAAAPGRERRGSASAARVGRLVAFAAFSLRCRMRRGRRPAASREIAAVSTPVWARYFKPPAGPHGRGLVPCSLVRNVSKTGSL